MKFLDGVEVGDERGQQWLRKVFELAYCIEHGPFKAICERLRRGISVLVYLPGNCIDAAAEYVVSELGGNKAWEEFGNHPGDKPMESVWKQTGGIMQRLRKWLNREDIKPSAIFKNLDRIFHNDNAMHHPDVQLALFSLIESTRRSATLGLADRDFGKLPAVVEAPFTDRVWLDEIDFQRFRQLTPLDLAAKLGIDGSPKSDAIGRRLATHLRFCDPIRAALIMIHANTEGKTGQTDKILSKIAEATRTAEFTDPEHAFPGEVEKIRGFEPKILEVIAQNVIKPYKSWLKTPDATESERLLRHLPPGLILYGPPGTGKTYLARWMAKAIGLPIRVVAGADIRESAFGQTERNIARLFRNARKTAPCMLVLDDADDLLVNRAGAQGSTASADRAIVSTFLQQLDGFEGRIAGVLVVLTTNRFSDLDPAVISRLPLYLRIGYPHDGEVMAQMVDTIAAEHHVGFQSADVRDKLIKRFQAPVLQVTIASYNADEENRFGPREIHQAMRILRNHAKDPQRLTAADIDELDKYYQMLADSPEVKKMLSRGKN